MPTATASEFWRWCCREYAAPGIAAACLALQDRFGANINLMLLLCWLDRQSWHLDAPGLQRLCAAPALDDPDLQALRGLRRRLKPRLEPDTYQQLQAVELQLERQQQHRLLDWLAQSARRPGHCGHHLAHYLNQLQVPPALWPWKPLGPWKGRGHAL